MTYEVVLTMITKEIIDNYIEKIPPAPDALRQTIFFLNNGELTKAANSAQSDPSLSSYLKSIVNKPIYGFKNEVSEISQIFGILGATGSQTTVYNYMISLLSPDKWLLFKLNANSFGSLQDTLSFKWKKILQHLEIDDKDVENSIALLPASIIVAEALFCEKIEDVTLIRTAKDIDYNTILVRLTGSDLFEICEQISNKWEMPKKIAHIVQAASGVKPSADEQINTLGKWMHLLIFFELSQPVYVEAGLNDFVEFQIDYVQDIYDDFASLMEIT